MPVSCQQKVEGIYKYVYIYIACCGCNGWGDTLDFEFEVRDHLERFAA